MTLTMIAVAGIVLAFACLIGAFFTAVPQGNPTAAAPLRHVRRAKKRIGLASRRKTA